MRMTVHQQNPESPPGPELSEIDLSRYFRLLRKWAWLLVLATVIAAGVSYYATQLMPRTYVSSITLMVGEETANARVSLEDLTVSQRAAAVYAGMVRRQPVLEATVNALGLRMPWRQLQTRVLVNRPEGSQFLEIRVTDTDPERAKAIAEELARQLILQSPTGANFRQLEERRQFVRQQLDALQGNIQEAETSIAEKRAALAREVSARAVLDLQDEIKALEEKITSWRTTYASLLTSFEGKSPNSITVIEPAFVPTEPVGPNVGATVLMAAAVGFLLALGAALLIEYLGAAGKLTTAEDVERLFGTLPLGSIQYAAESGRIGEAPVILTERDAPVAEAYRMLRTKVQFALRDGQPSVLLVTSAALGEGKSTTSANLAATFAQSGKRTILVDADLRQPALHRFFGVVNDVGLTSLFSDEPVQPTDYVDIYLRPTSVPGLRLLPSGPAPDANPAELLGSPRMGAILQSLRETADVVIVDGPPVLVAADAAILAGLVGAVILVIEAGRTTSQVARLAHAELRRVNGQLLGIVLNKTAPVDDTHYHYPPRTTTWAGRVGGWRLLRRG